MKTAVVGSRNFNSYVFMKAILDRLDPPPTKIISGGQKGADALAYRYACEKGIVFLGYPPLKEAIEQYGYARACKRRNLLIVLECERLVAFPRKGSKGTWHSVNLAKKFEKEVLVVGSYK